VGLYVVLTRVEIPSWPSAIVAAALAATPAALIYENWLFYEYPTAALLVLSAVALTAFLRRGSVALGVVFFSLVAAVVYVRSIFQVFWLLAALALLLLARRDLRRTTLLAVAPPLLAILLLVAKNAAVFGVLGTSSWWGMNLAQVVDSQVPQAERIQLVGEGKLSPVSAVDPFSPPRSYVRVVPPPRPRGVPVLDRLAKARGAPNMNNEILVRVSRDYAGDSFRLIRRRPGAYARAIVEGGKLYLRPTTDYEGLNRNREKIGRYERLFNQVFLLQRTERFDRICWAVLLAHLIALAYGLRLTYRLLRRRVEATVANTTLAYVWVTLAYATLVVTFAQVTENNRLRFFLDPLAVVLVAAAIRDAATRRAGRRPAAG
jgi:hypothetical protein